MNPMQQMLQNAQRMQRELKKAQDALNEKEFTVSKGGMVDVVAKGDRTITSIHIDKDALDADNAEMLQETLAMAINEVMAQIQQESDEIQERITGQSGMMF
ncbi:MAG: YbaB/EbfC family nucleoid-associated protein [Candidatus Enteromonas sp.]|nr:YbaB/EbfC family nucleoid-associated protein [Candidatus Enteromonas sp.]